MIRFWEQEKYIEIMNDEKDGHDIARASIEFGARFYLEVK
jgi:hypothetical protein